MLILRCWEVKEVRMGELFVKDKDIAVPGETLAKGMDYLPAGGAFRDGDQIIANQLGLISINGRLIKLIPLTGKYIPKAGDVIIGKIVDMSFHGWSVDMDSAYLAMLSIREASEYIERNADLTNYYNYNDIISAKIIKVTRGKVIDLSMKGPGLRKLSGGKIIDVTPSKVPRIIGKQGSMVGLIKDKTGCKIVVGQNGKVWIHGVDVDKELAATKAILMVEQESHTDGLTDKIDKFLEKELKEK